MALTSMLGTLYGSPSHHMTPQSTTRQYPLGLHEASRACLEACQALDACWCCLLACFYRKQRCSCMHVQCWRDIQDPMKVMCIFLLPPRALSGVYLLVNYRLVSNKQSPN